MGSKTLQKSPKVSKIGTGVRGRGTSNVEVVLAPGRCRNSGEDACATFGGWCSCFIAETLLEKICEEKLTVSISMEVVVGE